MKIPFEIHLLLAVLTLAVLMIAGLQALLLALQEKFLRQQSTVTVLQHLPPLETMETALFRMIAVGFLLLSLLIITGIYFYHHLVTVPLLQKIILATIAWVIFAILLVGRYYLGWRGRKAIYGTLIGVLLIIIISIVSMLVTP